MLSGRIQSSVSVVQYRVLGNGCSKLGSQKLVQGGTSRQKMYIQYKCPQFDMYSFPILSLSFGDWRISSNYIAVISFMAGIKSRETIQA